MRKIIVVLLSIFVLLIPHQSVFAGADFAEDVNNDGKINMFDYVTVKGVCLGAYGSTDDEIARADVNKDGKVNVLDYIRVKKKCFERVSSEEEINFTASEYEGRLEDYDSDARDSLKNGIMPSFMISNTAELNEFLSMYSYYATAPSQFLELASSLDDEYFESKTLLIAYGMSPSGGDEFRIENVGIDENEILMEVTLSKIGVTDDVKHAILTAEVSKSDIGECSVLKAELRVYEGY